MIDIIRINAKYKKALSRLSDKDKAYILDGIFSFSTDIFYEIKDNQVGDLLDLINGENELMCIKAMGKAKYFDNKAIGPMVEPMVKPMVTTKVKESKVKEDKLKEEYNIFIKNNLGKSLSANILKVFIDLGYKPNEDIDKFREWAQTRIIDIYKFKYQEFVNVLNNFYDYRIEQSPQKLKGKVWKSTLTGSFHLKELEKK